MTYILELKLKSASISENSFYFQVIVFMRLQFYQGNTYKHLILMGSVFAVLQREKIIIINYPVSGSSFRCYPDQFALKDFSP